MVGENLRPFLGGDLHIAVHEDLALFAFLAAVDGPIGAQGHATVVSNSTGPDRV